MNTPRLSLVTGKVKRDWSFQRLVDSIIEHTETPWELIVADASDEPYQPQHESIRVIHEKPRQTHTKGYNAAFRECQGEYILWLNDDAEVCPQYDTEAIEFMRSHHRIGLGALHYSENGGPFHVNQAWGTMYANFGIFRRRIGEEVGFFDEEISMYGADNSLALRILMSGRGVADIPNAKILHHSSKDHIRLQNQANRIRDNRTLTGKYMPYRKMWQFNYQKYRVDSGHEPWSHGVQPELAAK